MGLTRRKIKLVKIITIQNQKPAFSLTFFRYNAIVNVNCFYILGKVWVIIQKIKKFSKT